MNILIVSSFQIYPFETGASVAQFGIIENLSELCNISILLSEQSSLSDDDLTYLRTLLPKVKIHKFETQQYLSDKFEHPAISFSKNLLSLIRKIKDSSKLNLKSFISFLTRSNRLGQMSYAKKFDDDSFMLWDPFVPKSEGYVSKINEIIQQEMIDLVQFEGPQNLSLALGVSPNIKKVFVVHECRFFRIKSYLTARGVQSDFGEYLVKFNQCIELALIENYDAVITFSKSDSLTLLNALNERSKNVQIFTSPYSVLDRDFVSLKRENFIKPMKLTFVGEEYHFPNKDAVEWFLETAAKNISKKYGLRLCVIGKWQENTIQKYKNHESGVEFLGFVEDLFEATKNSISIVPVRIGGGLRTKIMVAMAQGIPVISTSFALNGINAEHLKSAMVADSEAAFCESIEYLLEDLDRTFEICKNAQNLVKERYSQSVATNTRYTVYQSLLRKSLLPK